MGSVILFSQDHTPLLPKPRRLWWAQLLYNSLHCFNHASWITCITFYLFLSLFKHEWHLPYKAENFVPAGSWPCFPSRLGHFSWEALQCRPYRHKLVRHSPSQVLIDGSSGVEQLQHCCCRLWKAFWYSCFGVTLPMTSYQAHLRKSLYLVGIHRLGKEGVDPKVCWSLGTSSLGFSAV